MRRCERVDLGNGVTGFVCTSGPAPKPKPCHRCGKPSAYLCDFAVRKGKTCDRACCVACRVNVGPERDLCFDHAGPRLRFAVSGVRPPPRGASAHDLAMFEALCLDMEQVIDALPPTAVVIHGDAAGIDRRAADRARARGLTVEAHPPNPSAHGGDYARAAMARNAYVETADRVGCFVAPWTKGGTWDAHRRALAKGVEVTVRQVDPDGTVRTVAHAPSRPAPAVPTSSRVSPPAPSLPGRLRVRSGRLSYRGPDAIPVALDICRAAVADHKPAPGLAFAPTEALLRPAIAARREAEEELARADRVSGYLREEAEKRALAIEQRAWDRYRPRYLAGMRISSGLPRPEDARWGGLWDEAWALGFRPMPEAWWALPGLAAGAGGMVTFTCFCGERWRTLGHCHAILLCEVLAKLGAENLGEVTAPPVIQGSLF